MRIMLNVPVKDFDQLGAGTGVYKRALEVLPAQLQGKLKEARFGYLNAANTPEPTSDAESALEAEIKRLVQSGSVVVVDDNGQVIETKPYEAPTTVVGEGGSYGYLFEFGGEQTMWVGVNTPTDMDLYEWKPSDEQVAFMCLHIK